MAAKKSKTTPDKRRKCDDAFKAEVLRMAAESRSMQAAAQQLGSSPKLFYCGQQAKSCRKTWSAGPCAAR